MSDDTAPDAVAVWVCRSTSPNGDGEVMTETRQAVSQADRPGLSDREYPETQVRPVMDVSGTSAGAEPNCAVRQGGKRLTSTKKKLAAGPMRTNFDEYLIETSRRETNWW
jgi:hypothetical protein